MVQMLCSFKELLVSVSVFVAAIHMCVFAQVNNVWTVRAHSNSMVCCGRNNVTCCRVLFNRLFCICLWFCCCFAAWLYQEVRKIWCSTILNCPLLPGDEGCCSAPCWWALWLSITAFLKINVWLLVHFGKENSGKSSTCAHCQTFSGYFN